jgi:DNA-binding MarR family transcriptional regulator
MKNDEVVNKARYLFTAGKLIHDRIYEAGSCYFNDQDETKADIELSLPQKNLMLAVRRLGTVSMSDLASQLGVSPPSASAMVDRLVEKKILTREHSTEDRRKVVVRISDNAMSMMDGIEKNMLGVFIDLVEKIGPKTTAKWCQVLKRVESVLASNQPKSRRKHNEPGN